MANKGHEKEQRKFLGGGGSYMTPLEQKFRGGGWSNRKNNSVEGYGYFLESHIVREFTVCDFKMWLVAVLTGDCINNEVIVSLRWR